LPWKPADAKEHVRGVTAHQAVIWSRVANAALRACTSDGASEKECEGKAIRQANAVAQRAPAKAIKADGDGGATLSVLAVPFIGPFAGGDGRGVDGDGEFFTETTDLCLDWFPSQRPLLYHHGLLDGEGPGIVPVGRVDVSSIKKGPEGWWVQAELDRQGDYFKHILKLLEEDALYASTGAMAHLVRTRKSGEITQWPWVELSLTPTPANFFATVQPAEAKSHYKAANLPEPSLDSYELRAWTEVVDLCERLAPALEDYTDLTSRHAANRSKVGRALSEARRKRLSSLMDRMREGVSELESLLAETGQHTEPEAPQEEAKAAGDAGSTPEKESVKAAAPAPELESIYRQFQETVAFYEALGLPTKETARR
jgi:hypothetical protein